MRWIGILAVVLMLAWCMSLGISDPPTPAERAATQQRSAEMDALVDCQFAIKAASLNSDAADVPPVKNWGKPGDYYFAWPRGSSGLRLQNGFGAMLDASAACFHDGTKITGLTINGKDVIGG